MKKVISLLAATALVGATMISAPQAQAKPGVQEQYAGYYGPRRGYRHRGGNAAGAAAAVGIAGALIGAGIAASQRDRYYEGGYGYGHRAPAYYGPGYYDDDY